MSKRLNVLIIEDVEDDAILLVLELQRGGFDVIYEQADTVSGLSIALDNVKVAVYRVITEPKEGKEAVCKYAESSGLQRRIDEAALIARAYKTLTPREREVLRLAAEGRTASEIAALLFISQRTVESHRARLMRKLGLHNQTDLIRFAQRVGILPRP